MKYLLAALTTMMVLGSTPVNAGDFQSGLNAYQKRDYATALREWTPLAEEGDVKAQYNLGNMYRLGKGVSKDYTEAAEWYRMAATQGFPDAQYTLGVMHRYGRGVSRDYVQAYVWANMAEKQRHMEAKQLRKTLARKLTRDAVEDAKRRAKVCLTSKYKNCD
jgi:uncharacterized protein